MDNLTVAIPTDHQDQAPPINHSVPEDQSSLENQLMHQLNYFNNNNNLELRKADPPEKDYQCIKFNFEAYLQTPRSL